jgi:chloramphenicol 3-O-phosphotransferase
LNIKKEQMMNQKNQQTETEIAMSHTLSDREPALIVVTGVMAAGKSTIARLLAQRYARGVHINADTLQQMIVSGGKWVSEAGEPAGEAARQLRLRLKNLCLLGRSFFEAGFTVVLDDIIMGDRWQELQEELRGFPFSLVILAPQIEVVLQRDQNRPKTTQGKAWAEYLDRELRTMMAGIGLWVDSTDQTPQETVDYILWHL